MTSPSDFPRPRPRTTARRRGRHGLPRRPAGSRRRVADAGCRGCHDPDRPERGGKIHPPAHDFRPASPRFREVIRYGDLAWLGHQDALKPGLTLAQNLALAEKLGTNSLSDALEALDLTHLTDLPARLLSSGQKRRAAFARVMLSGALLWLLDEPTVGLDVASIERLGAVMAAHRAKGAMIVTTHVPLPSTIPVRTSCPRSHM